jgi:hypothetical protein
MAQDLKCIFRRLKICQRLIGLCCGDIRPLPYSRHAASPRWWMRANLPEVYQSARATSVLFGESVNGFGERLTGGLSDSESSREYVLDPYEKKFFTGDESLTRLGGEHWVWGADGGDWLRPKTSHHKNRDSPLPHQLSSTHLQLHGFHQYIHQTH